jgi:hypothetical protein
MSDNMQGLRDDVAFMRNLAEDGRNAPLLGGEISMAAGLCFGAASLAHYAALKGWLGEVGPEFNLIWIGAGALFAAFLVLSIRRQRSQRGAAATVNRATGSAWQGVGLAVFAIFGGFIMASARTGEWIIMAMLVPVILALYGAAWAVAGEMTGRTWIKGVAGLSLILSVLTGWLAGTAEQYLVYAAALVLTAFIPGVIMLRQERRAA